MALPVWQTQPNLGSFVSNQLMNVQLFAIPLPPATSITYTLAGGALPNGVALTAQGLLQGIPFVFSTAVYTFTVRATDNLGNIRLQSFYMNVSYALPQPVWNTPVGSIGTYPSTIPMTFQLSATPTLPAVTLTYEILSGSLPTGLSLNEDGLIFGTPVLVSNDISYDFVVRATDNYQNIKDRTFSLTVSGSAVPQFTTPTGTLITTLDSTWIEIPVEYSNPISSNPVSIRLIQGQLPPGVEVNNSGLIRGYAEPPILSLNLPLITTAAVATNSNTIVCVTTDGFRIGRPIIFTGTEFGGITANQTYYINSIIDETTFTISTTVNGGVYTLSDAVGFMNITLPTISVGQPTIQTYSFTLKLESPLGSDIESYFITVINQNASPTDGGPGYPPNTRIPTIYNTRPPTYNISANEQNYGYYVLPPDSDGYTYQPSEIAYIGKITSDNYFSFRILGNDFDGSPLEYVFADLPLGLTGDSVTGWINGYPVIADNSISDFTFSVAVRKATKPEITTPSFNFGFRIRNDIVGDIEWITPTNLGQVDNGTVSTSKVQAVSDVTLQYRLVSGLLPPNLTLLGNGEISGVVAYQPTSTFLAPNSTTDFTFTIQAYSPQFPIVQSSRTFTLSVYQEYGQPTDTLYIKCTPSISDRHLLASLLNNNTFIPEEYLYRPQDPYFGKSTSIVYEHAFGIYASNFDEYVAAITKNHYWRQITLGELKTAVARNDDGDIIYEVVYSQVVDNLVNPQGQSISEEIFWPRFIPLELGPWYTSVTDIYTSYVQAPNGQQFYTSLTPGFARTLYPNSLPNMRERVGQELGQEYNFRLLPKWMTSQQLNGSTLGYTPAWVICYTLPGFAETIKNNINNNWIDPILNTPYTLNTINFKIDRFTVDKSTTFNYDKNVSPPAWTGLPSASPTPNPLDSKDFYVLFPRETILPNRTQY